MTDYFEPYEAGKIQMFVGNSVKTIKDASPGLLITLDNLQPIFKTEYSKDDSIEPICYCSSGEYYCGDVNKKCVEVILD